VPFGVVEKKEVLLGSTILLGRERERLDRWNDDIEKRRFFLSSLRLSVSAECVIPLSGVVVNAVVRDVGAMNSGSSEASREDGIESVRELGACITTTSACGPRALDTEISV
jgi:hypothetical protein